MVRSGDEIRIVQGLPGLPGLPMSELSRIKALTFNVFGATVDWFGGVVREVKAMFGARYQLDWVAFANHWRVQ